MSTLPLPEMPIIGPPPAFSPPLPELATLRCGLPVWLLRRPDLPLLSLRLGVLGGSSQDLPGRAGLSSLADSVLTRGAGDRDALAFAELTERLALSFSVGTSTRATTLGFDSHLSQVALSLDLLADVVRRPRMQPDEIERVRALRLGELLAAQDEPDELARSAVQRAWFGDGHPQMHLPRGRRDEITGITADEIRSSWAGRASPARALLVACGDFDPDALLALLEERFGDWSSAVPAPSPLPIPARTGRTLVFIDKPGATQTQIALLAAAPSSRDPGLHGARLAAIALGGMFTSRLNRKLREEKGYTYGVSAQLMPGPELSLLSIRTAVQRDPTPDALQDLLVEVDRLAEGLAADELERARLARITQIVQALETRSGVAESFLSLWEAGRTPGGFRDEIPALQAQELAEVTAAAARLEVDRAAVVVVGDLSVIGAGVERVLPGDWQRWPPAI